MKQTEEAILIEVVKQDILWDNHKLECTKETIGAIAELLTQVLASTKQLEFCGEISVDVIAGLFSALQKITEANSQLVALRLLEPAETA